MEVAETLRAARERLLRDDVAGAHQLVDAVLAGIPGNAEALHLAALAAARRGDAVRALVLIERALERFPDRVVWLGDAGILYTAVKRWPEAVAVLSRAAALQPGSARINELLARALFENARAIAASGDRHRAIQLLEQSIAADPHLYRSRDLIADLYTLTGQYHKTLEQREAMARLRPEDFESDLWLAKAQMQTGDLDDCLNGYRSLIGRDEASASLHSEYLCILLHHLSQTGLSIRAAHEAWGAKYAPRLSSRQEHTNEPDENRRIRIGYLSGEFNWVPFCHFLTPILRHHDRASFEITCYYTRPKFDSMTDRFRAMSDRWRNVAGATQGELRDRIRRDEIDILVDLSGHYPWNRLDVFAQRPAPVQVAFPNYPATTGVAEIDYIFSDAWVCGHREYTEEAYLLSSGYLVWDPPDVAPDVTALPACRNGYITFGLFQRPGKLNASVWNAVAGILRGRADSRLLVHSVAGELDDPESRACRRIVNELESRGVSGDRVRFRGTLPLADHLALLSETDVALDTFPYNGQTTTCECLWMGVPVVSRAGNSHVARVGHEILDRAGLGSLAACDSERYVQAALDISSDTEALAAMRANLRDMLRRSPLLDGARVTREIEEGFRSMWRRWCASPNRAVPNKVPKECKCL